ncbi:4018_t:CDS:2, partial [Acaulospora morrowiae]
NHFEIQNGVRVRRNTSESVKECVDERRRVRGSEKGIPASPIMETRVIFIMQSNHNPSLKLVFKTDCHI